MSLAPLLLGYLSAAPAGSAAFNAPWLIAGAVKIAYDIILYALYRCDGTMSSGEAVAAKERADDAKDARAAEAAAAREAAQPAGDDAGDDDAGAANALDAPLLSGAPRAACEKGKGGRFPPQTLST